MKHDELATVLAGLHGGRRDRWRHGPMGCGLLDLGTTDENGVELQDRHYKIRFATE